MDHWLWGALNQMVGFISLHPPYRLVRFGKL